MKKSNLMFLEILAHTLETFTLDKSIHDDMDNFIKISESWCSDVAEELRKIVLEERMGDGKEDI